MLRAALLALTLAPVALAVDPVDELTMAIRNGSPREALEKTQVWLRNRYEEPDGDDDEGNEEVRWIAEQLRAPDNKMTIEEVLAKAKRRRAERSRGREPMPSGFREDDSHVGYSGGPGEGRIVAPRLG